MAYGGISQHPTMRGGGGRARVVQRAPRRPVGAHTAPSRALVRRAPVNVNTFNVPPQYALGDGGDDDFAQFGGFSIKGIAKAIKKVASPVQKAAAAVGHTVGNVVTSKVGQGILGGALALTGVGAPAAAAIFATTKGVGNLIKPGGNIKHAVTGAAQGAVEGVASVYAGKAVRAIGSKILNRGGGVVSTAAKAVTSGGGNDPGYTSNGEPIVDAATNAAQIAAAQQAQAAAAAAAQDQARQLAELQAAQAQAVRDANDAQAAALAEQVANAQAQAAAAAQATAAANAAAQGAQSAGPGVDVSSYVDAARQAAAAAAAAAAAPPTSQGTSYAQQAADAATDASTDASAGAAPEQASILGGNPLLIGALIVGAVLVFGKKKRKQGAR